MLARKIQKSQRQIAIIPPTPQNGFTPLPPLETKRCFSSRFLIARFILFSSPERDIQRMHEWIQGLQLTGHLCLGSPSPSPSPCPCPLLSEGPPDSIAVFIRSVFIAKKDPVKTDPGKRKQILVMGMRSYRETVNGHVY